MCRLHREPILWNFMNDIIWAFWYRLHKRKLGKFGLVTRCDPILGQILVKFFANLVISQSYDKPPWRNFDFWLNLSKFWNFENRKFEILNPSRKSKFWILNPKIEFCHFDNESFKFWWKFDKFWRNHQIWWLMKFWILMKFAILVNVEIWILTKFGNLAIVLQNLIINLDRSRSQLSKNTKIVKFGQISLHKIQNS